MDNIEDKIKKLLNRNLEYEIEDFGQGKLLVINELNEESLEYHSGLRKGDKILKINNILIDTLTINQIDDLLKKSELDDEMEIIFFRNGQRERIVIGIQSKSLSPNFEDDQHFENESFSFKRKVNEFNLVNKLEEYTSYKRHCHWITAKYFERLNKFFVIPSIIITAISGMLSFISSSSYIKQEMSVYLALTVGCLASLSSLIQSFSNAYGFANKAEAHENAAESFDQVITKVRFSKYSSEKIDDKFLDDLKDTILEIKQRCKYIIPDWVDNEYKKREFESNSLKIFYETKNRELKGKNRTKLKKLKFYEQLFEKTWDEKINKEKPTTEDCQEIDNILNKIEVDYK